MKTYITKLVKGSFVSYPEEIDSDYWSGKIGTTYQDYLNGKWVLLNNEQVAFHEEHPKATVKEVYDMELYTEPESLRTLEDAKAEKKQLIEEYNDSSEINDFTVNSQLHMWLTPTERANYRNSIDSSKVLGLIDVRLYVGDYEVIILVTLAEQMLALIQRYADQCYMVTKNHLLTIDSLETIEEVDSYDFESNYPLKLNFDIEL